MSIGGRLGGAVFAALVARSVYRRLSEGDLAPRWARTNHRNEPVTLAEGPAIAVGSLAGVLVAPRSDLAASSAALVAVAGASALGALDDLTGASEVKGLRGHLGALRQGQVTTGGLKLFGLGVTGLAAGALARRGRGGMVDAALAGSVVAGAANLVNLFDLRPGRAAKVFLLSSAVPVLTSPSGKHLAFGDLVAAPAGAAVALLGEDLAERSMMGDTGANAIGAAWGVGAAASMSRPALAITLAGIGVLTLLSERVSFSDVIDRTPALHYIDMLGRAPS